MRYAKAGQTGTGGFFPVEIKVILMDNESVGVVFPGQGSQRPGMGKDFFDQVAESRQVYEEASAAVGWDVAALCFGEEERLNLTAYTQPCILATEIAMLRGLQTLFGLRPSVFAGHSLGEFSALVAAGALPLGEAVAIVHERGRLMQEAAPVGMGGMAAVIADNLSVEALLQALGDLPLDIANINSPRQVVISGDAGALPEAERRITEALSGGDGKGVRFVRLHVSAPFHSRFMRTIEAPFAAVLRDKGTGRDAARAVDVASNYRGGFHTGDDDDLLQSLTLQLGHPVRWRDNMTAMARKATRIFEIGPGRPLRDFFRAVDVTCESVVSLATAERLFKRQGGPAA